MVCAAFIAVASAAKVKKPIEAYFADFASEEDIHLITGEDDRPPTYFAGDVMKAKTTSIKTKQGANKFNYKCVFFIIFLVLKCSYGIKKKSPFFNTQF